MFFFFIQVGFSFIDDHKKMIYTNFQIFLTISLAVLVEIFDLPLGAVIDSFQIYIINSWIKKKSETNFIMSDALSTNKKNSIIIIKGSTGSRKSVFQ